MGTGPGRARMGGEGSRGAGSGPAFAPRVRGGRVEAVAPREEAAREVPGLGCVNPAPDANDEIKMSSKLNAGSIRRLGAYNGKWD